MPTAASETKNTCVQTKALKKSLDPVRRCHLLDVGFNTYRMTFVFGKLVEISQLICHTIDRHLQFLYRDSLQPIPLLILSQFFQIDLISHPPESTPKGEGIGDPKASELQGISQLKI